MIRRILAVAFIFVCTAVAWAILSATIYSRTESQDSSLRNMVASAWGAQQEASPPAAEFNRVAIIQTKTQVSGQSVQREVPAELPVSLPLESSRIDVGLDLEHRQKGLLWYSTYKVAFGGEYVFRNPVAEPGRVEFRLKLPAVNAIYDGLQLTLDSRPLETRHEKEFAIATADLAPGATAHLAVAYRSQGLDSWRYQFGGAGIGGARDFLLTVHTNFRGVDFAENALSPTEKRSTASGWDLQWRFTNLVTGCQIALVMPEKQQPGPLAGEISMFAPVSLFFFFFVLLTVAAIRRIDLHPMNYFFLAGAFFAFHLLLAYLADHISIHWAFGICSAVSVFLVISYLRLVVALRFAALVAGGAQLVYLVLFSYAFFFRGYTGLAITIGAIVTLFLAMQATGRVRWSQSGGAARDMIES
jgi:inner membrane protein involved in colicin E2 resistance